MDSTTYKYRGKICDFDFYVFSIDTQQHCKSFEKLADHLTLNEAVEEYKRRDPYTSNDVLLVLGVNFLITAPEYRHDKVNIGAFDLLQRVNGEHLVTATDETALHGKAAEVAAEIQHHNEMEDSGKVPDDELSL